MARPQRNTTLGAVLVTASLALAACGDMMMSKPAAGGSGSTTAGSGAAAAPRMAGMAIAARLSGAAEVPPIDSTAGGSFDGSFDKDSNLLRYKVTYTGLSGPATAAHIHGPAMAGTNAGVVIPFKSAANPIQGEATLTASQAADLMAGRLYVNVHTAMHPGGEVRGQLQPTAGGTVAPAAR